MPSQLLEHHWLEHDSLYKTLELAVIIGSVELYHPLDQAHCMLGPPIPTGHVGLTVGLVHHEGSELGNIVIAE